MSAMKKSYCQQVRIIIAGVKQAIKNREDKTNDKKYKYKISIDVGMMREISVCAY